MPNAPPRRFSRAIVRAPAPNFADGLTTQDLGAPDIPRARAQHDAYCAALADAGVSLQRLAPDPHHPDSTFVEDTAVIVPGCVILARPGAPSRLGEVDAVRGVLARELGELRAITAPGTLDGGDVCEAGTHVFVGLSDRTNEEGARQLGVFLARAGHTSSTIDIRGRAEILHLKSGLVSLDDGRLVAIEPLAAHPALARYEVIRVAPGEEYCANCVRVNDVVFFAAGFPRTRDALAARGYRLVELDMSEFRRMDGGLSCLSLRW